MRWPLLCTSTLALLMALSLPGAPLLAQSVNLQSRSSRLPSPAAQSRITTHRAALKPGQVKIETDLFGVGSVVRPGGLAGIRLLLTDRGDRVRDSIVQLHLRDPDGDEELVERPVTLNPGRAQTLWLYARLPNAFVQRSLLTITVHESVESGAGVVASGQIAAAAISPQRVAPITDELIAVVGRRGAGLEAYTVRDDSGAPTPTTHELINVVTGVAPADLPDAWMGLAPFEALVWVEGDPTLLRADQADAIRQWITRGGRLFIVLPSVGQLWTNSANPLLGVMPAMVVTRREGVDLEAYRRLLMNSQTLPLPTGAVVHVFDPSPFAGAQEAISILDGPDGRSIAMRRLIGLGDVTVIGLDLGAAALTGRIDAQVIWHRLLGERFDVRTRSQITDRLKSRNFPRPQAVNIDAGLAGFINKTGSAGVGVMLGLVVFVVYFLLAGPIGFGLLSRAGLRRHSWLVFIGVAGVFTIIAWGGATIIRPRKTDITHVSILDAVHGQNVVRVRSWFSVLLPTYGSQTVAVGEPGSPAMGAATARNVLWPWQDPTAAERAPFPDRRSYTIDSRRPDSIRVPTRSTVKEFESWWLGPPPWRLPRPKDEEIDIDDNGALAGAIVHELPAALENVVVVLVRGQTPLVELRDGGPLLARVWAWSPFGSQSWPPGQPLDLRELDYRDADTGAEFFKDVAVSAEGPASVFTTDGRADLTRPEALLEAMTWYSALEPPNWTGASFTRKILTRRSTHGLDLGRWLTQPCLIVVGELSDSEIPAPITVEGEKPPSTGRTIVRWVYPLPPDPPRPARGVRGARGGER